MTIELAGSPGRARSHTRTRPSPPPDTTRRSSSTATACTPSLSGRASGCRPRRVRRDGTDPAHAHSPVVAAGHHSLLIEHRHRSHPVVVAADLDGFAGTGQIHTRTRPSSPPDTTRRSSSTATARALRSCEPSSRRGCVDTTVVVLGPGQRRRRWSLAGGGSRRVHVGGTRAPARTAGVGCHLPGSSSRHLFAGRAPLRGCDGEQIGDNSIGRPRCGDDRFGDDLGRDRRRCGGSPRRPSRRLRRWLPDARVQDGIRWGGRGHLQASSGRCRTGSAGCRCVRLRDSASPWSRQ